MNKFNPNLFKMGYIIAYMNVGDFFGNQIVKRQLKAGFPEEQAQITHIEISGGGVHSVNIAPPFSKSIDITKRHKGRYVYLLRYRNDDYEKRGRYKVAYFSATLCNIGYDVPGIFRFVYKWIGQNNRLWFCSEGALYSIQKEYPKAWHYLKPEDCMPAHMMDETYVEKVWNGFIS